MLDEVAGKARIS